MNTALAVLGSLGGVGVFCGAVWALIRGMLGVTSATKANTEALQKLTAKVDGIGEKVTGIDGRVLVLEDRGRRSR